MDLLKLSTPGHLAISKLVFTKTMYLRDIPKTGDGSVETVHTGHLAISKLVFTKTMYLRDIPKTGDGSVETVHLWTLGY
jgi:hypothetical protein